jgi:Protein of unknown function DUF2625
MGFFKTCVQRQYTNYNTINYIPSVMVRYTLILLFTIFHLSTKAQQALRPIEQLIDPDNTGWKLVKQMIKTAKNKVEILSCDTTKARVALFETQVTTRSPMGAIVHNTGGLLIAKGWIRILGAGNPKLNRSLPEWNRGKSVKKQGELPTFWLVADDVVGGFFAINGGSLGQDTGMVYYMAPDNVTWDGLGFSYTEFLSFCFNGNLALFYKELGWKILQNEAAKISGDKVFNFVPPLWSKQGKDISKNQRMAVPAEEQYQFNQQVRKQFGLERKVQQ